MMYIYIVLSLSILIIIYLIKENRRLKKYEDNYKKNIYDIVNTINYMNGIY